MSLGGWLHDVANFFDDEELLALAMSKYIDESIMPRDRPLTSLFTAKIEAS
jgi:hypothetical protein